jgi:hypothetical protein
MCAIVFSFYKDNKIMLVRQLKVEQAVQGMLMMCHHYRHCLGQSMSIVLLRN